MQKVSTIGGKVKPDTAVGLVSSRESNDFGAFSADELHIIRSFRALEPRFKELMLNVISDQAAACIARRPRHIGLKLVSSNTMEAA